MEVDIDWPHQVGNDKPLGKWLLYLEDLPIVEGTGGGECSVAKEYVNPLNLKFREPAMSAIAPALTQDPALLKRSNNKSHSFAMEYRERSSSTFTSNEKSSSTFEKKSTAEENILNRVRRDRSMIIRADKLIDQDGKKTNIVKMVRKVPRWVGQ